MRPLVQVPRRVWLLMGASLAAQLWWCAPPAATPQHRPPPQLAPPAPPGILVAASFGEPVALARLLMLYVQSADGAAPLAQLDYTRLVAWLDAIVALDARGQYPLLAATQVYAAVQDEARVRQMLDFTYRQCAHDPGHRWPHLAHAALLARHRLHDLPLARRYARAIRMSAGTASLPPWTLQMEALILADMQELEAAQALIGAMLASGQVQDPNEVRLLERRLEELAAQAAPSMR